MNESVHFPQTLHEGPAGLHFLEKILAEFASLAILLHDLLHRLHHVRLLIWDDNGVFGEVVVDPHFTKPFLVESNHAVLDLKRTELPAKHFESIKTLLEKVEQVWQLYRAQLWQSKGTVLVVDLK